MSTLRLPQGFDGLVTASPVRTRPTSTALPADVSQYVTGPQSSITLQQPGADWCWYIVLSPAASDDNFDSGYFTFTSEDVRWASLVRLNSKLFAATVTPDQVRRTAEAAINDRNGTATPGASSDVFYPKFTNHSVQVTRAQTGLPSILAPMVFATAGIIANPLGKFYMLNYTDHDSAPSGEPFAGKGGIGLMYGDSPVGPWKLYSSADGKAIVYQDTVVGDQTENAYMVYWPDDPDGKPIYVYYAQQGAGINQSTLLAKSATGLPNDFQRVGIVIQGRSSWPGDGQSTYFQPRVVDGVVVGTHLMGGGDNAQLGISRSYDGINFVTDPRRFGHFSDQVGTSNGRRLSIRSMFKWRGDWFAIGAIGPHTSGFLTEARVSCVVKLTRDFRSIVGSPFIIPDEQIKPGGILEHEGRLYLYYRTGDAYSSISVAIAEA